MAEICFPNGIRIDTEDIDLLVTYCPLATLDAAVKADTEILISMPDADQLKPYFQHRLESHQLARDIAERTIDDGVCILRKQFPQYTVQKEIIKQSKTKKAYKGIEE